MPIDLEPGRSEKGIAPPARGVEEDTAVRNGSFVSYIIDRSRRSYTAGYSTARPRICAAGHRPVVFPTYRDTIDQKASPRRIFPSQKNVTMTAGFRWAPERLPQGESINPIAINPVASPIRMHVAIRLAHGS
jgi:hypothetical protein